ncbi:MAG: PQQ-binding-like beta-propeller repeat protein [Bacteroidales bacterium]|nr:PQQ-binding-like beta-propeller repeat protein [Bacteroidales bacterium]
MTRLLVTIIYTIVCISVSAQQTSQWRGPNRDGIYNENGLMTKWPDAGPGMIWHYDGLGQGHASAAVTTGGVYTSGMIDAKGYIFAFDHQGRLRWKKEYGPEWSENHYGTRSTPLIVNDRLYFISSFGLLFCMNTANGQIIWSIDTFREYGGRNTTWGLTENLLYDGNVLYATPGGRDVSIIAVDRQTGKLLWKTRGTGELSAYCSPLLISLPSRKLLVTMMQRSIQGYDASTGKFLWSFPHVTEHDINPNIPYYKNGYLYCASGYGTGGVMLKLSSDGSGVTQVWKNSSLDPKFSGFVVLDGKIYGGGDRNRRLFCLDWETGKEIYSLRQLAPANVISNSGLLYFYSESGQVSLLRPKSDSFEIISSFKVPMGSGTHWAHLVINNKRLYVRHGESLMVYDIAAAGR